MDQYKPTSGGASSHELLAGRLQRIRRVLNFAGARVAAIRRDHDAFWAVAPDRAPALDAAQAARVDAFKRKADLAQRLIAQGEQIVADAARLAPAAALVATGRFDADQLATTARELDALIAGVQAAARLYQARALDLPSAEAPEPAPGARSTGSLAQDARRTTGPLPAEPAQRPLTAPLVRWFQALTAPGGGQPEAARPAARGPVEAYLDELAGACETVRLILEEVSTELAILRAALAGTALPVPRRPWPEVPAALEAVAAEDELDPVQTSWLAPVAKRLYMDADAVRRAHVAVTQWQDARAQLHAAERQRRAIGGMPPERQKAVMQDLHPGKLRATILPLTHLHVTFQPVPVLSRLFPPPESA